MLSNCGIGEDSFESLGLQGDQTSLSKRKSFLNIHWKDSCWRWSLATWCEERTHWKRPWCWERSKAGGEGDDRGWDGWLNGIANTMDVSDWTTTWDYVNFYSLSVFLPQWRSFNVMIPPILISWWLMAKKSFHFLPYLCMLYGLKTISFILRVITHYYSQIFPDSASGSLLKFPFLTCPSGSLSNSLFSGELRCFRLICQGIFPCLTPGISYFSKKPEYQWGMLRN